MNKAAFRSMLLGWGVCVIVCQSVWPLTHLRREEAIWSNKPARKARKLWNVRGRAHRRLSQSDGIWGEECEWNKHFVLFSKPSEPQKDHKMPGGYGLWEFCLQKHSSAVGSTGWVGEAKGWKRLSYGSIILTWLCNQTQLRWHTFEPSFFFNKVTN